MRRADEQERERQGEQREQRRREGRGRDELLLVVAGGVVYTAGVVFHAWERLPYQNAIWHGFVLAAAAIHFAAVWGVVLPGG